MTDMRRFMTIYTLFAAAAVIIIFRHDVAVPITRPLIQFPEQIKTWRMSRHIEFDDKTLAVLKATDYLARQYAGSDGKTIQLYIGYHSGSENDRGIHSPKNCLPGSGWLNISSERGALVLPDSTLNIVRAVYQKGDARELFLYWFQVRGHTLSNEYALKLATVVNSSFYGRRDASFIRVSVPVDSDVNQSRSSGEQFIRDIEPIIREFLPR